MENTENIVSIAAHLHTLCAAIVIIFHSLLILGKPWGHLTMGGKYPGKLSSKMKFVSGASILILISFILIVESTAGDALVSFQTIVQKPIIVVVAYNVIGTILHIITPSRWERTLWLPIILIMLSCSSVVWWLT